MTDLQYPTQDVTIHDETSGVKANVVEKGGMGYLLAEVRGEVTSQDKADNPIYFNVLKTLATATESEFLQAATPIGKIWYLTSWIIASQLDCRGNLYFGIQAARVENKTGITGTTINLDYMAIPITGKWTLLVNGVNRTADFAVYDNPTDYKKSQLIKTGGANLVATDTIVVTYDAVQRIAVAFSLKSGSQVIPLETPVKLPYGKFIYATIQNRSNSAGEASITLIGFEEIETP
jgi:hypothetical protein